jgi:hypothetical protein
MSSDAGDTARPADSDSLVPSDRFPTQAAQMHASDSARPSSGARRERRAAELPEGSG